MHEQHEHDDEVGLLDDEAREDDDEVVVSVASDEVVREGDEQEIRAGLEIREKRWFITRY